MATRNVISDPVFQKRRILRFWKNIDQSGGPEACWPWLGPRNDHGYGIVRFLGRKSTAHRIAYELYNGGEYIADGLVARHKCDNRLCCNPQHIEPGTQRENLAEMRARGRAGDNRNFGEKHGRTILTDAQVGQIRDLYSTGDYSWSDLAKRFGVGTSQIGRIVNGTSRVVTTSRQPILIPGHSRKPGRHRKIDRRQLDLLK